MRPPEENRSQTRSAAAFRVLSAAVVLGLVLAPIPGAAQDSAVATETLQAQGGSKKHRKRQQWPIKLGTSGGNAEDLTPFDCCGGTLGALIEKNGIQYILSNNHVLARTNRGKPGEAIIQPGYLDQGPSCTVGEPETDIVAHLTSRKRLKFDIAKKNRADVAIAEVIPGAVDPSGRILKIGVPGTEPVDPVPGMQVKKAGRTTGLTRGTITLVNTSAFIEYTEECASTTIKVARFVDLIWVEGNDGPFSDSGDSGSMAYQDVGDCPSPVGLLFAGSPEVSVLIPASRLEKVVQKLRPKGPMSFVGCNSTAFEATAGPTPILSPPSIRGATAVMRQWEDSLFANEGVHGVGIGVTPSGAIEPAIYILASEYGVELADSLPEYLDGYRVLVRETPRLVAQSAPQCDG